MGGHWWWNRYSTSFFVIPLPKLIKPSGHNIERMHNYFPISSFDAVYVVDLCEPLLQVARKRFADKGWANVTVLCQDASLFSLPEWFDGNDPKGCVSFVTLSYSLSMVRSFSALAPQVFHQLFRFLAITHCWIVLTISYRLKMDFSQ
jgi:betaine lipid synthase